MIVNKLKNQRCYLAGAMDRVPDRGSTWRENISPFLESLGVMVFNPLKKPSNIGQEDETVARHKKHLKQQKRYDRYPEH